MTIHPQSCACHIFFSLIFLQGVAESVNTKHDDCLLKCLIELADNVPKFLRSHLEGILPFCLKVKISFLFPLSRINTVVCVYFSIMFDTIIQWT